MRVLCMYVRSGWLASMVGILMKVAGREAGLGFWQLCDLTRQQFEEKAMTHRDLITLLVLSITVRLSVRPRTREKSNWESGDQLVR